MAQKYIRLNNFQGALGVILTFPDTLNHLHYSQALGIKKDNIVSAGFVCLDKSSLDNPIYKCYGTSISLKIDSIPEEDSKYLNYQIYGTFDSTDY